MVLGNFLFSANFWIFFILAAIISILVIILSMIESSLSKRVNLKKRQAESIYQIKIRELINSYESPSRLLNEADALARKFLHEKFNIDSQISYDEIPKKLKRKAPEIVRFSEEMSRLLYAGERIDKVRLYSILRLLAMADRRLRLQEKSKSEDEGKIALPEKAKRIMQERKQEVGNIEGFGKNFLYKILNLDWLKKEKEKLIKTQLESRSTGELKAESIEELPEKQKAMSITQKLHQKNPRSLEKREEDVRKIKIMGNQSVRKEDMIKSFANLLNSKRNRQESQKATAETIKRNVTRVTGAGSELKREQSTYIHRPRKIRIVENINPGRIRKTREIDSTIIRDFDDLGRIKDKLRQKRKII